MEAGCPEVEDRAHEFSFLVLFIVSAASPTRSFRNRFSRAKTSNDMSVWPLATVVRDISVVSSERALEREK